MSVRSSQSDFIAIRWACILIVAAVASTIFIHMKRVAKSWSRKCLIPTLWWSGLQKRRRGLSGVQC
jgi:hypothetical protein